MFNGQSIDQSHGTILNLTYNLIELCVPLTTGQVEIASGSKYRHRLSVMNRRSDEWKQIREDEDSFGRNSIITALAWSNYSSINLDNWIISINR